MTELPPELAPALRARAEALLAECKPAAHPPLRPGRSKREPCYVCHKTRGPMGGHHVIPGDDSSVVPVHRGCHRKLHAR